MDIHKQILSQELVFGISNLFIYLFCVFCLVWGILYISNDVRW